jgi:hypothetical protein
MDTEWKSEKPHSAIALSTFDKAAQSFFYQAFSLISLRAGIVG